MNEQFQSELRDWLEANAPASMRTPMPPAEVPWGGKKGRFPNPESREWLNVMAQKGYTAAHWPVEYGGAGLDGEQAAILAAEIKALGLRSPLWSFGLWMLGPVLMEYGTEEQRRRFLPSISRGETRWCQGYSEPAAGSDLASLKTRAEDKGDHYLVNGQKVWTSYADEADWIFCLVRTDRDAPKHKGISFLLIDMETPGVEVRPIRLISGESPFCETFFDDVKVPKENLVGAEGEGWTIAKKLLEYERQNVSAIGFGGDRSSSLADIARKHGGGDASGKIVDPVLRNRIAGAMMYERAVELLTAQGQRQANEGRVGFTTSVVKYASAKINRERDDLAIDIAGLDGTGWAGDGFEPADLTLTRKWLRSKGNSIEGGTSEVQLDVLAKNALGLPRK